MAIHTLRMPMPYRCPHTKLAYPSSVESLTRLIFTEDPSKWVDHGPCNALCRDVEPDERLCAACNIKKDFVLQLRGACKDSLLGIFIALRFSKFSKTKFSFRLQIPDSECGVLCWFEWMDFNDNQAKISTSKPYFFSPPRYSNERSQWEAKSTKKSDFLAISKASKQTLLLGTQTWTFENDSHECSLGVDIAI